MGPLAGLKVIEVAAKGPIPFCAMLLSDLGAEVLRLDRSEQKPRFPPRDPRLDFMNRGRRSAAIDLKHPDASATVLRLVERADVLIEGFRPGVMERLGLGPDVCLAQRPSIIYGRATGWGQSGPLANSPGHDITYLALSGLLDAMRRGDEKPMPPLNVLGDYAGGGLMLAFGVACAVVEASKSGRGQVIDAAMIDGVSLFGTLYHALRAMGQWNEAPGTKVYDTGAPYYDVYRTADGKFMAVGAIEPQFFAELARRTGLPDEALEYQNDNTRWPDMKRQLTEIFATRTRDEWCALLEGRDACVAPVLSLGEAPAHVHHQARGTFITQDGMAQPAPAPRFSRTPAELKLPPPIPGEHTTVALQSWGFSIAEIEQLLAAGTVSELK